jgi:predicted ATPase
MSSLSRYSSLALAALVGSAATAILQRLLLRSQKASNEKSTLHHYDPKAAAAGTATNPAEVKKLKKGSKNTNYVYRIVLTGGPCGGKSSSLSHLTKALTAKGFDIMCVPEVPTILLNGGCKYPGIDGGSSLIAFEKALIQAQLQLEKTFVAIAESVDRPTVVIMDRGLLDVAAYLPPDLWKETLQAVQLTEEYLADRYDLVLHLVTAADGAESFYTTANNEARTETSNQAKELDQKIRECYKVHKNLKIVDNSTDFEGKMKRATNHVLECITISGKVFYKVL